MSKTLAKLKFLCSKDPVVYRFDHQMLCFFAIAVLYLPILLCLMDIAGILMNHLIYRLHMLHIICNILFSNLHLFSLVGEFGFDSDMSP